MKRWRRARREFRRLETAKEECREARGARSIDEVSRNLTCARRSIRQHPGFAIVAVLSLAVGIGANLAVFGVLQRLVLSTLPVRDPGALYHIISKQPNRTAYEIPFPKFVVIRDNFDLFTLFGWGGFARQVTIGDSRQSRYVLAVTGNYFETLGVQPALGRLFDSRDEKDAIDDVAVISHALWRSAFGGQFEVLGRTVDIDGKTFTIAGVAPTGFDGFEPGNPADIYLTLHGWERLQPNALKGAGLNWFHPVARLKHGVSIDEARAIVRDRWAGFDDTFRKPFMRNGRERPVARTRRPRLLRGGTAVHADLAGADGTGRRGVPDCLRERGHAAVRARRRSDPRDEHSSRARRVACATGSPVAD